MAHAPYGTRYDARITELIRKGRTITEISRLLGPSHYFIGRRGHALGLRDLIYKNGLAGRMRGHTGTKRAAQQRVAGNWRKFVAEVGASRGDRLVSDVARSLRARPVELSDAAVAALHERGLTIDELCQSTCRVPLAIVRVVREAVRCS